MTDFDSINIQVLLASPNTPLCDALNRYGFFKRHSSEMLFPSVSSAVRYAKGGNKLVNKILVECVYMITVIKVTIEISQTL